MFQAVREWLDGGRWRRPARLFAFEFVVVMAGVLAAQGLQNWAARQSDRERGEAQIASARTNIQSFGATIRFWTKYGPCMREHVRRIATVAGSGGTLTQPQIGRPALPVVPITPWTEEGRQRALLGIGERELSRLVMLNATATTASDVQAEIAHEWATLRLIDQAMGNALPEDRSRVRQGAAVIDNRIGFLMYAEAQVGRLSRQLNIPMPNGPTSTIDSLVDRCGLLKDWR